MLKKMAYKHTQIGYLMIAALIIPIVILFFAMTGVEFTKVLPIVFFILLIALALFFSLTVEVDETKLIVKFGFGVIKKKFILKDIESCRVVKNPWYYGWGIHYTPHGWLYNISGFSAVEIQMKNHKTYRMRWLQNFFIAKFCYLWRDKEGKQKYLNRSTATEKMFLRSLTKSQLKEQNCSRKNFVTILIGTDEPEKLEHAIMRAIR